MKQLNFPFTLDSAGRTAHTDENAHIRALIAQVLFTDPGERVNRPDFGSGVRQMVFGSGNDETISAAQFLVQSSLEQWLGEIINVEDVAVEAEEERLNITIQYTILRTNEAQTTRFTG